MILCRFVRLLTARSERNRLGSGLHVENAQDSIVEGDDAMVWEVDDIAVFSPMPNTMTLVLASIHLERKKGRGREDKVQNFFVFL